MSTDILLLLVGVAVGGMNSIAGGGMLFGFPVMLALGIPPIVANATSSVAVIPGQIGALIGYQKYIRTIPNSFLILLIPLSIGASIGAYFLTETSPEKFKSLLPLLLLFVVGLFIIEPFLHFRVHLHLKSKRQKISSLTLIGITLLPLAIYGGYFGIGFGFMLLTLLGLGNMNNIHRLTAVKNIGTCTIAITTATVLIPSGLINWRVALMLAIGTGVGGYVGARVAQRFSSRVIRLTIICIGLTSVGYLIFRVY